MPTYQKGQVSDITNSCWYVTAMYKLLRKVDYGMKTCMLMALQISCQIQTPIVPQSLKLYHCRLSWRQIRNEIFVVFIEGVLLKACSYSARVRKGRQRCACHHELRLGWFFPPARSVRLSAFLSRGRADRFLLLYSFEVVVEF